MRYLIVLALLLVGAGPPPLEEGTYPRPLLTPGVVDPHCTLKDVSQPGYTAKVRSVKESEKKQVFVRYGIDPATHSLYEVDHLISLELCGANDIENLWPEPYGGIAYTARMKDQAEDWLARECRAQRMTLEQAQKLIVQDWVAVYRKCCEARHKRE